MPAAHVVLVPGLLGFERLGSLAYFTEVEGLLGCAFVDAGVEVRVDTIGTPPTSSIQDRAARLAEVLSTGRQDEDIHLVGHSTGGLDCRVLVSPGIGLPTTVDVEAVARRVRSLVTISTPHHGSPLATAVTGVGGHLVMSSISRLLTRLLQIPVRPRARLVGLSTAVLHLDRIAGVQTSVCDPLRERLEHEVIEHEGEIDPSIEQWLREIGGDSTLLEQLTPTAVERLTATLVERPGVREGSVVTRSPPPGLRAIVGLRSPTYARLTASLYVLLHRLAGAVPRGRVPSPTAEQSHVLERDLGAIPGRTDNDGFVPSRSQVWGSVIAGVEGDHLDLMGYYGGRPDRPRLDMLASGAPFDWHDFESTWRSISAFLLDARSR